MSRTAERVESLLEGDAGLAEALGTVYDRTNEGTDEVEWADVRDDLSSGHWGRLIETGLLVDGEEGFVLADPETVASVLDGHGVSIADSTAYEPAEPTTSDDGEDQGWTIYDKAAAVFTVALFAGYSVSEVRDVIGRSIDLLLGPLDAVLPFYVVVMALALLTGLYSTLLQANLMDMDKMSEYQQRMKDIQQRQKAAKEAGDDEALERIREEQMAAMGDQLGMFKLQFRPMVWIMLFTIPVFLWMYWMILDNRIVPLEQLIVIPLAGPSSWQDSVVGPVQLWIVWYFLCSMAFTQILRKALNIQTTPT